MEVAELLNAAFNAFTALAVAYTGRQLRKLVRGMYEAARHVEELASKDDA
jgi:hypothetical protein